MFILRFIQFLFGYVQFRAAGGFPERFLNLCSRNHILLWNVRGKFYVLTARTAVKNYKKLRPFARRSGMRLRVMERHGVPFFLHRHRKRVGALVGFIIFVLFLVHFSSLLWTIDVVGNQTSDTEHIMAVFSELGLEKGVKTQDIDITAIELEALQRLPELSWVAVNMKGSHASIEVRERVMTPELLDEKTPCNVVASYSGKIVKLEAYDGNGVAKIGESVLEGDLLISGVLEDKAAGVTYKHARGVVMAQTQRQFAVEIPLDFEEKQFTGKTVRHRSLEFFGLRIPLYLGKAPTENADYAQKTRRLKIAGIAMPIAVHTEMWTGYELHPRKRTQAEAESVAKEQIAAEMAAQGFGQKVILDTKEEIRMTESSCQYSVLYLCEENIGREAEILFDRLPSD